jgi:signal transduction histidine kinase
MRKLIETLALACLFLSSLCAYAYDEPSLYASLKSTTSPAKRIEIFEQLAQLHFNEKQEVKLLISAANTAKNAKIIDKQMYCYAKICRNYLDRNLIDSISPWRNIIVAHKASNYDAYFIAEACRCMPLIDSKNFRGALDLAMALKQEAENHHNSVGKIIVCGLFAMIYDNTNLHDKAVDEYGQGISMANNYDVMPQLVVRFYLYLPDVLIRMGKADEALAIADESMNYITSHKESLGNELYYNHCIWYIVKDYMRSYIILGDKNKATIYNDKVIEINNKYHFGDDNIPYLFTSAQYNCMMGNYDRSLAQIDYIINHSDFVKCGHLLFKAQLLNKMHRYKESYLTYTTAYDSLLDVMVSNFNREISQLNTNYVKYDAERIASQKIIDKARLYNTYLFGSIIVLLILFLVSLILYFFNRKIRMKLERSNLALSEEKNKINTVNDKLSMALEDVEKSNKKKSEFLENMSHEIRTPLNTIVGFSDLISSESDNMDDTEREYSDIIKTNSDLMLKLVNDILDMSQLDSSIMNVDIKPVDIVLCARNTLKTINTLAKENVRVTFSTYKDSIIINSDKFRLQQLLTNLLGNAAKFTVAGEINLTIKHDVNGIILFIVTDTGCGISKEEKSKIFNRYEKLNEAATGTGLGLYISRLIAEKLGGRLYIDDNYTGGARFIFEHPEHFELGQTLNESNNENNEEQKDE